MAKQKAPTTSRKKVLVLTIVSVLLVGIVAAWITHTWPFQRTATVDPNASRNVTTNTSPKNNNPTGKEGDASPTGDKTSDQVPVDKTMVANITQLVETNNTVKFTATVNNTNTAGTCVVTFSNPNDRPITQQATAMNANNVSTCGPINIPANEFSYLGEWKVDFHYYVAGQQATTNGAIIIQ
jgi:flagellar basal body-associated protein FliL